MATPSHRNLHKTNNMSCVDFKKEKQKDRPKPLGWAGMPTHVGCFVLILRPTKIVSFFFVILCLVLKKLTNQIIVPN